MVGCGDGVFSSEDSVGGIAITDKDDEYDGRKTELILLTEIDHLESISSFQIGCIYRD